jgi:hypothetical protein
MKRREYIRLVGGAARATAAVKYNSLRPERSHPQLKRDLLCVPPS